MTLECKRPQVVTALRSAREEAGTQTAKKPMKKHLDNTESVCVCA